MKVEITVSDLEKFGKMLIAEAHKEFEDQLARTHVARADVLLEPEEVRRRLGISATTLWRWTNAGTLVPIKIGNITKYRESDVLRLIA